MSSFRKRNVQKEITRTSPQTGRVIISSDNPSLDVLLGGSLPIGSICLIKEDKFVVTYSKVLAKYFMAEGILSKQTVFLSLDNSPKDVVEKFPKPLDDGEVEKDKIESKVEYEENQEMAKYGLRIAWRYNYLPMVSSEKTNTQPIRADEYEHAEVFQCPSLID